MDKKQFNDLKKALENMTALLVLIAYRSGAKSDEIGKVLGVSGGQIRNILAWNAQEKTMKKSKAPIPNNAG